MGKSIHIIEQDSEVRSILETKLKEMGYDVLCPVDSYVGLECVMNQPSDLLLINDEMPIINGQDLVKMLREQTPQLPVIVFLATNSSTLPTDYTNIPHCHCIRKPFQIDALMSKVSQLINT